MIGFQLWMVNQIKDDDSKSLNLDLDYLESSFFLRKDYNLRLVEADWFGKSQHHEAIEATNDHISRDGRATTEGQRRQKIQAQD